MEQSKNIRAKKMMLWFSMISISMTFAGLTSAYVVSKSRPDWLEDFSLPMSLYWSTLVILLSSVTFWQANKKLTAQPKATAKFIMGDPGSCVGVCILTIPGLFESGRYGILFHWCAKQCHDFVFICLGAGSPRAFGRWTRRFIGGDYQSSSWKICGKPSWIFPRTYLLAFFRVFVGVFVSLSIFFTINHVFLYNQNSNAFLWTQR